MSRNLFRGLGRRLHVSREPFAPGVIVHHTRRPSLLRRLWTAFVRWC